MKTYKVEVEFEEGTNGYRIPRAGRKTVIVVADDLDGIHKFLDEKLGVDDYSILSYKQDPELLPCPFCGHVPDLEDPDTLYPTGICWVYDEELEMVTYRRMADRQEGDQFCYVLNCSEQACGCGVELHADSREECITKWNIRYSND